MKNDFEIEMEDVKDCVACMVKPIYHIFKPVSAGSFEAQWHSCFKRFQQYCADNLEQKAFIVRIFVGAKNEDEFQQQASKIKDTFSENDIPFSILSESPEKPGLVLMEAGFTDTLVADITYGQVESLKFSKLIVNDYAEYWFAGAEECKGNTIYDASRNAFRQLSSAFQQSGIDFNNIVRQWNYVEQIFSSKEIDHRNRQNYQQFNEVRSQYYSKYRTEPDFPAATGIGVDFNGVSIECMLVKSNKTLQVIPISNPKQLNSYKYGQVVLRGESAKDKKANQAPQFERAKLITDGENSRVFISGTASIVGQETIGLGNIEKQTRVSIDNIELLTSEKNLKSHCPELTVLPDKYAYVRVYVKNEKDFPLVKTICREHFGEIPMCFVKADICRADLLVEIEAEKIS